MLHRDQGRVHICVVEDYDELLCEDDKYSNKLSQVHAKETRVRLGSCRIYRQQ